MKFNIGRNMQGSMANNQSLGYCMVLAFMLSNFAGSGKSSSKLKSIDQNLCLRGPFSKQDTPFRGGKQPP
jgi:hypothetical protein